jgi:hypothetical protein
MSSDSGMSSDDVRRGLATSRLVDVSTIGRKTGKTARMEIPCFNVEGRLFIVGDPRTHDDKRELRPRDWYANLNADPRCTVALKNTFLRDLPATRPNITTVIDYSEVVEAEAPATAVPVKDPLERRRVLEHLLPRLRGAPVPEEVDDWVAYAPVAEVTIL